MRVSGLAPWLLILLVSCGGSDAPPASAPGPVSQCAPEQTKAAVLEWVKAHYLWNAELPEQVRAEDYPSPETLLSALTASARAAGKDRNFSAMITPEDLGGLARLNQHLTFGIFFLQWDDQLRVAAVLPDTPAAKAALTRGDAVLALATSAADLASPDSLTPAVLARGAARTILDANRPQAVLHLRILRGLDGAIVDLAVPATRPDPDPVPGHRAPIILDGGAGHRVGYLPLRLFSGKAEAALRTAMGALRAAGATDLIIDLRYNPGGRVATAQVLASLLRPDPGPGEVLFQIRHNPQQRARDFDVPFLREAAAFAPRRLAFIVSGFTASAGESLVKGLEPFYGANLALVGGRTHGKPVGQEIFQSPPCPWALALVTFELRNGAGIGGFFQGLPDPGFTGAALAAPDDLGRAPGDPLELSTRVALAWIAGWLPQDWPKLSAEPLPAAGS